MGRGDIVRLNHVDATSIDIIDVPSLLSGLGESPQTGFPQTGAENWGLHQGRRK